MKAAITKEQFLKKISPKRRFSLEQRLGVDFDTDITIDEIVKLLEQDSNKLIEELEEIRDKFDNNSKE